MSTGTGRELSLDQCLLYRTVSREIFFRNMEIVGVIPARFASTRLPGKALLSATGRPLIQHVVEAAQQARSLQRIIVATDDDRIAEAVTRFRRRGHDDPRRPCNRHRPRGRGRRGSRRGRIIVNLQGDEPEISGAALDLVVALLENDREAPMATLATPIRDESIYRDPSCVKVVCSRRGRALYFSRSPIPCHRDGLPDPATAAPPVAYLHLGLYAYRREFLLDARLASPFPTGGRREARAAPRARSRLPDRRRHRRRAERRHRHARRLPPVRRAMAAARACEGPLKPVRDPVSNGRGNGIVSWENTRLKKELAIQDNAI